MEAVASAAFPFSGVFAARSSVGRHAGVDDQAVVVREELGNPSKHRSELTEPLIEYLAISARGRSGLVGCGVLSFAGGFLP